MAAPLPPRPQRPLRRARGGGARGGGGRGRARSRFDRERAPLPRRAVRPPGAWPLCMSRTRTACNAPRRRSSGVTRPLFSPLAASVTRPAWAPRTPTAARARRAASPLVRGPRASAAALLAARPLTPTSVQHSPLASRLTRWGRRLVWPAPPGRCATCGGPQAGRRGGLAHTPRRQPTCACGARRRAPGPVGPRARAPRPLPPDTRCPYTRTAGPSQQAAHLLSIRPSPQRAAPFLVHSIVLGRRGRRLRLPTDAPPLASTTPPRAPAYCACVAPPQARRRR